MTAVLSEATRVIKSITAVPSETTRVIKSITAVRPEITRVIKSMTAVLPQTTRVIKSMRLLTSLFHGRDDHATLFRAPRGSAPRESGRVIVSHDPFFSREAAWFG